MRLILFAAALAGVGTAQAQPRSAEAATRAAIERIKHTNPAVNAVLAIDPDAIAQARELDRRGDRRAPLFGMPILLKDNIETRGRLPTTAGSLALADNVTDRDAPLVARLRAAGAVILGKANMSEWANFRSSESISGWSAVGGQVRNPFALDRNPCGSSSGSAAAVSAGMVDAAIGTETDGSITCPASVNGIVGFKPTLGLVSRRYIVPISPLQDTAGPMARDVTTAARVLAAIAGSDPQDPATVEADAHRTDYVAALDRDALNGRRIGVLRFSTGWSQAVDAMFEAALGVLRAQGAALVEIDALPHRELIGQEETAALRTEFKAAIDDYLASTPAAVTTRSLADLIAFNRRRAADELALFGQDIFEQAQATRGLSDSGYKASRGLARQLAGPGGIDRLLGEYQVVALVGPTVAPAWKIDVVNGDQVAGGGPGGLAAVAGYPHLTVPAGAVKGLPVGLSFIGAAWSDARILAFGYAYEQAARVRLKPEFVPSLEQTPEVARHLAPKKR